MIFGFLLSGEPSETGFGQLAAKTRENGRHPGDDIPRSPRDGRAGGEMTAGTRTLAFSLSAIYSSVPSYRARPPSWLLHSPQAR